MNRRRLAGILRYAIGLVLLAAAAGKLADVRGFAAVLETYRAFPAGALLALALGIPLAELGLAIWLLSGRRLAVAAAGSAGMHAVYAGWSAASIARGVEIPNCGCFGVFLARPLTGMTVVEDIVMTALSVALFGLCAPARGAA